MLCLKPSLSITGTSYLIFPASGFLAKIGTEERPGRGVEHWYLLLSMGLSLPQTQVCQEELNRQRS